MEKKENLGIFTIELCPKEEDDPSPIADIEIDMISGVLSYEEKQYIREVSEEIASILLRSMQKQQRIEQDISIN